MSEQVLLRVEHLVQRYRSRNGTLEAISDVSFTVGRNETLGLVGESGCGKSSTARAVLQLPRPTEGTVELSGKDLTRLNAKELRAARRRMPIIFQDPVSALNPRRKVKDIVGEGLIIAGASKGEAARKSADMLDKIGMDIAVVGERRPHELSGGQCQRIAIARALVLQSDLLICDEPVASLDVSIQGQVLNLLDDMRRELSLTMLFISHDLSVVHNVSDRIAVMYLGKLVEMGGSDAITRTPAHPYTRSLLDAVPVIDPGATVEKTALTGEVPSPMAPPSGCRFRTRCPLVQQICAEVEPKLRQITDGRQVACHFPLRGADVAA